MQIALPTHFQARLVLYGLDEAALARLSRLWPIVEPAIAQAVDDFIAAEKQMPTVAAVFQRHDGLIRELTLGHMRLLLSGSLDQRYIESCQYVSERQIAIGLTPRTQIIGTNMILRGAIRALGRKFRFSPRKIVEASQLVSQALAFDTATTLTIYQDAALQASQTRAQQLDRAIADFHATIDETIGAVKSVAEALSQGSADMRRIAEETAQRMASTAEASRATTSVVEQTAAATQQLTQSIDEIGVQSAGSLRLASSAAEGAELSLGNLAALSQAVEQIQSVAGMISDIAGQTNLLALNATIEAARAGDAGRGFAVVAGEVKALANQTEKATESISRQIGAVHQAAQDLAAQLRSVTGAVKEIAAMAARVASAVNEQTAATRDIANSVQAAAKYTIRASEDVRAVEGAATRSFGMVEEVVGLSERLSSRAADLEQRVAAFFASVRSASGEGDTGKISGRTQAARQG
jgi:methyl-accepting chemotaxis protein